MAYQIIWLPKAEERFKEIVIYLEENWSESVAKNFIQLTEKIIEYIKQNPKMFRKSNKKEIHEAVITKHNLLLYRIKNEEVIELLTFFDIRQRPRKKFNF